MFVIFCQVDKLITVCIWSVNNAGLYFFVCMWVCYCAFRKEYFDDCDEERKFTMYPNGDQIFFLLILLERLIRRVETVLLGVHSNTFSFHSQVQQTFIRYILTYRKLGRSEPTCEQLPWGHRGWNNGSSNWNRIIFQWIIRYDSSLNRLYVSHTS